MKEQEGIFTEGDCTLYHIFKGGGMGWHLGYKPDWSAFNKGDGLWPWSSVKDKKLGTLKVPMEYLT